MKQVVAVAILSFLGAWCLAGPPALEAGEIRGRVLVEEKPVRYRMGAE